MEKVLLIITAVSSIYSLLTIFEFIFGFNKIQKLSEQPQINTDLLPTLSIILSALNEEEELEKSLTSLLNLDYPRLEIIAVNDRSSDKTPDILEKLKKRDARLHIYHIHQLPEGWLGKNHALYFAAQRAQGEWLLFTDADVLMKSDTLLKAMNYVIKNKLDHLTLYESHHPNTIWLKLLLLGHYLSYSIAMKPWRIRYAWSKKSLGHGAFNLVKKETYQQCGGHQSIAMECLDDLKLGALIKSKGFRQDTVEGRDYVYRRWYSSLSNMIAGCKKNSFAYYEYRLLPAFRDLCFALCFYIWPFIGVIYFSGLLRWLNILNISLILFLTAYVAKQFRIQKRYALFYPVSILLVLYSIWNSVFSTFKNKGVIWRGTYYSLQKIKGFNTEVTTGCVPKE